MPELMIVCPIKRKPFSTGFTAKQEEKEQIPDRQVFSQCPHCGSVHSWRPSDAFFADPNDKWEV